jgi:hypothetical protein
MMLFQAFVISAAAISSSVHADPAKYAEVQVWEYKTRPQDAGSLIKIQKITELDNQQVYHLSVIGVHLRTPGIAGVLPHMPVSTATLDASVIQLSSSSAAFPTNAVDEGIAEWQRARGGVFTIPVSQIIDIVDEQTSKASSAN